MSGFGFTASNMDMGRQAAVTAPSTNCEKLKGLSVQLKLGLTWSDTIDLVQV